MADVLKQAFYMVQGKLTEMKLSHEKEAPSGEPKIRAYANFAPRLDLKPFEYVPDPLGPYDVEVAVDYCGFCHTDIAVLCSDLPSKYKLVSYPAIPGHEVVGRIVNAGSSEKARIGERVGVGWFRSCDGTCEACKTGDDNLCPNGLATCCQGQPGGFAERVRVQSHWAIPIPDALPSEKAAPLMCAGVTVFAPMQRAGLKPGMKVGIVGIGGLGHLAVQFAKAMGAEVTAFTTHPVEKGEDLFGKFHADHVVHLSDEKTHPPKESLDWILQTVYKDIDLEPFMDALKPRGTLVIVGWMPRIELPNVPFIYKERKVEGSNVGSTRATKDMLAFAANHNILPLTEVFSMDQVNQCFHRFLKEPWNIRYRQVLKVSDAKWEPTSK
jgi:uncharacterized zinc-type alcohol dehydrogenase-like protein